MLFSRSISKNIIQISKQVKQTRFLSQVAETNNKDVIYEKLNNSDAGISVISLNRPKARNSFGLNLITELENILTSAEIDKEVRVVIIRSLVPGMFCAGADLKERLKMSNEQEVHNFVVRLRSLMNSVQNLPVPVIAALDGIAVGGGLELALSCDIRTASTSAKMGLVETRLATIPGAGGTQRLPRLINPAVAKELMYTARIIDGAEAEKLGIVNHAVVQNKTGNAAFLKALDIAKDIIPNGPFAVKMAKEAINKGLDLDLQSGMKVEEECTAKIIPTYDRIEGLKAFNEKRQPKYIGE